MKTLLLQQLAASHGHRAKAEHREISCAALTQQQRRSFAEVLASMPNIGLDSDFDSRNNQV